MDAVWPLSRSCHHAFSPWWPAPWDQVGGNPSSFWLLLLCILSQQWDMPPACCTVTIKKKTRTVGFKGSAFDSQGRVSVLGPTSGDRWLRLSHRGSTRVLKKENIHWCHHTKQWSEQGKFKIGYQHSVLRSQPRKVSIPCGSAVNKITKIIYYVNYVWFNSKNQRNREEMSRPEKIGPLARRGSCTSLGMGGRASAS